MILPQDYIDELQVHSMDALLLTKDRRVDIDARAMLALLDEITARRQERSEQVVSSTQAA